MTLNDFIDEQLKDPEFKKEWEASEKEFQEMLARTKTDNSFDTPNIYRSRKERNAVAF